uniref:Uncharacterized protein n=1 Tax=Anguilla anguilla TaxID=7936 RepID=A0A0E9QLM7_ANGAN
MFSHGVLLLLLHVQFLTTFQLILHSGILYKNVIDICYGKNIFNPLKSKFAYFNC